MALGTEMRLPDVQGPPQLGALAPSQNGIHSYLLILGLKLISVLSGLLREYSQVRPSEPYHKTKPISSVLLQHT